MTNPTPEDVERVALLPCPFCGETEGVYSEQTHPNCGVAWCSKCNATHACNTEAEVIRRWNRRAAIAAMPDHFALIRELRDALKKWGSHNGWCASNRWPKPGKGFAACDCGFDAARKANETLGEKA